MKVISLNTWGGRAGLDSLLGFFRERQDVDIFCLQEIGNIGQEEMLKRGTKMRLEGAVPYLLQEIEKALPQHASHFKPHVEDFYGLAMFVKRGCGILAEGDVFVYKEHGWQDPELTGNHARNLQYMTLKTSAGIRTVLNIHGLWTGGNKTDTADRLLQSERMIEFLKTLSGPFVVCGDFNLLPDTDSLSRLENFGLRNLVKEYKVISTRTKFYEKEHKFADYVLLSAGIIVREFSVLPDEVSDHSPLYLEFE